MSSQGKTQKAVLKKQIAYGTKSLHEDVKLLFWLICYAGTDQKSLTNRIPTLNATVKATPELAKFPFEDTDHKYAFRMQFKEFVTKESSFPTKPFQELLIEFGLSTEEKIYRGFNQFGSTATLGFDSMQAIFCISARLNNRSLHQHILEFINDPNNVRDNANWSLKNEYIEKLITNLKKGDYCLDDGQSHHTNNEKASVEIHATQGQQQRSVKTDANTEILIQSETEKIRERLGFYPYKKDERFNPKNALLNIELKNINRLLKSNPSNSYGLSTKAAILSMLGDKEEAYEITSGLLSNDPNDTNSAQVHLMLSFSLGKYKESQSLNEQMISLHPKNYIFRYRMLLLLFSLKKYDEAEKQALVAIKLDSSEAPTYLILSEIYVRQEKNKLAIKMLEKAKSIAPNIPKIYENSLSRLYCEQRKFESLEAIISIQNENQSSNFESIKNKILSHLLKKRHKKAVEYCSSIAGEIENDPFMSDTEKSHIFSLIGVAYENLSDISEKKQRYTFSAKKSYEKAIELWNDNPTALEMLCLICFSNGDLEKSKEYIGRADTYHSTTSSYRSYIHDIIYIRVYEYLLSFNKTSSNLSILECCTEKYPDHIGALICLADHHFSDNNRKKTGFYIDKALSILDDRNNSINYYKSIYRLSYLICCFIHKWDDSKYNYLVAISTIEKCDIEYIRSTANPLWHNIIQDHSLYLSFYGRLLRDKKYLEKAIEKNQFLLENAHLEISQDDYIEINNRISDDYKRINEIQPNHSAQLKSIEYLKNSFSEISFSQDKKQWLSIATSIASKNFHIGKELFNVQYLIDARDIYERIIDKIDKNENIGYWFKIKYDLANTFFEANLIDNDVSLDESITHCIDLCEHVDSENYTDYLFLLADCYLLKSKFFYETEIIDKAIFNFQNIINICKSKDIYFAHYGLGRSLTVKGESEASDSIIHQSIENINLAISYFEKEKDNQQLASALNDQSLNYYILYDKNLERVPENLEKCIALLERTKSNYVDYLDEGFLQTINYSLAKARYELCSEKNEISFYEFFLTLNDEVLINFDKDLQINYWVDINYFSVCINHELAIQKKEIQYFEKAIHHLSEILPYIEKINKSSYFEVLVRLAIMHMGIYFDLENREKSNLDSAVSYLLIASSLESTGYPDNEYAFIWNSLGKIYREKSKTCDPLDFLKKAHDAYIKCKLFIDEKEHADDIIAINKDIDCINLEIQTLNAEENK